MICKMKTFSPKFITRTNIMLKTGSPERNKSLPFTRYLMVVIVAIVVDQNGAKRISRAARKVFTTKHIQAGGGLTR